MEDTNTPLLDKINFPKDLRKLPKNSLENLADELSCLLYTSDAADE